MRNYMASSSFRDALAKMSRLETVFINEIQSDVASSLIDALEKSPSFKTLYVGVGENDLRHARKVSSNPDCKISLKSLGILSNVNTSFSHLITARSQSAFRGLVMLNSGLDLATPLPDIQRQNGLTAKLQSFRAKVEFRSSLASHDFLLGNSIRAMKDLQRLELAASIRENEDILLPLDSVINNAHWQSLRHCTFTGAKFSFPVLVEFLDLHMPLEQISFRNLALTNGTWAAVFSHLAEVKRSQLQRLDLGDELWADGIPEYERDPTNAAFAEGADADMYMNESFRSSVEKLCKVTGMSHTCINSRYISYSTAKIDVGLSIDLIAEYLV